MTCKYFSFLRRDENIKINKKSASNREKLGFKFLKTNDIFNGFIWKNWKTQVKKCDGTQPKKINANTKAKANAKVNANPKIGAKPEPKDANANADSNVNKFECKQM